jgi:hypothetical protein
MTLKTPLEETNLCFLEQKKLSCNPILPYYSASFPSKRKAAFRERFPLKDLPYPSKNALSRHHNKTSKFLLSKSWESQFLGKKTEREDIVFGELERLLNPPYENKTHRFKQTTYLHRANLSRLEAIQLEKTFFELANQWRRETNHMSLMSDIILHPAYQRIIGMGLNVVPLILRELSKEPDHWFWALRSITGANPIKPEDRGRLKKMAEAWLDWGRQHGYKC